MIEICIGSSCHIKGSYNVITQMKHLIEEHHLTAEVELKSSFCLGHCGHGVSVRLNEDEVFSLQPDEVNDFFIRHILEKRV